jgi:hypothetical protein
LEEDVSVMRRDGVVSCLSVFLPRCVCAFLVQRFVHLTRNTQAHHSAPLAVALTAKPVKAIGPLPRSERVSVQVHPLADLQAV